MSESNFQEMSILGVQSQAVATNRERRQRTHTTRPGMPVCQEDEWIVAAVRDPNRGVRWMMMKREGVG